MLNQYSLSLVYGYRVPKYRILEHILSQNVVVKTLALSATGWQQLDNFEKA
jgi:hypothetical protein